MFRVRALGCLGFRAQVVDSSPATTLNDVVGSTSFSIKHYLPQGGSLNLKPWVLPPSLTVE